MIQAVGDGPAQSVYTSALDKRIKESGRWAKIHDGFYHTLDFSLQGELVSIDSLFEYQVDGILTALVLVHLLAEPSPISPFLVYAALFKPPEALDFLERTDYEDYTTPRALDFLARPEYDEYRREHLLAMIPDKKTRRKVAKAINLTPHDSIPWQRMARDPLGSIAMTFMEAPATYLQQVPRDEKIHASVKRQLLGHLLIGSHIPWKMPQFIAFSTGVRLGLCKIREIVKVSLASNTLLGRLTCRFVLAQKHV
jgi:hypothetical protein